MNRGKSYRLLIILLFFAFISLISRSLIYLIISLTIAFIIVVLLSKDKTQKLRQQSSEKIILEDVSKPEKRGSQVLSFILLSLGVFLLAYGITGYLQVQSLFNDVVYLNDPFLHILAIIVGGMLTLYSFVALIKKYLEV